MTIEEKQQAFRERFLWPLQKMFAEKRLDFSIKDMERILFERLEFVPEGLSLRKQIEICVSKEAADLYGEMLIAPFPSSPPSKTK